MKEMDMQKFMKNFYLLATILFTIGLIANILNAYLNLWAVMGFWAKLNWITVSLMFNILLITMMFFMYKDAVKKEKDVLDITIPEQDLKALKDKFAQTENEDGKNRQ